MPVYALHSLNSSGREVLPMEEFPSRERAACALQTRARKQRSAAFFLHDAPANGGLRPQRDFPGADLSGFLVVWLRRSGEPQPQPTDRPDEVWRLTERGAVRREPWEGNEEDAIVHGRVPAAEPTPAQRRQKALGALRQLPPVDEAWRGTLSGPVWHALSDLLQDAEAEDAVLRFIQSIEQ